MPEAPRMVVIDLDTPTVSPRLPVTSALPIWMPAATGGDRVAF